MTKLTFTPIQGQWRLEIEYAGGCSYIAYADELPSLLDIARDIVKEDTQHEEGEACTS